jgi:tetratricopeptide (TPR) repeat protein
MFISIGDRLSVISGKAGFVIPILILLFTAFTTCAQNLDSLKRAITQADEDTTKINALNNLGRTLMYNDPDTAIALGEQALQLSEKGGHKLHKAKSLLSIGVYNSILGEYDKALEYYDKALPLFQELNNLERLAAVYNSMGIAQSETGQFNLALENYLKSLDAMTQVGNKKGISVAYNSIGNVYIDLADYAQAIQYHQMSLTIKQELNDNDGIAFSFNNIGLAYKKQSDFPRALEYYFKSLELRQEMNDKRGMAMSLDNIGNVYQEQRDYKTALEYHQKSLTIVEEMGNQVGMAYSYNNLANLYAEQEDYPHAIEYSQKALKIWSALGNGPGMAVVNNNISGLYVEMYTHDKDENPSNAEVRKVTVLLDSALSYSQEALAINTELDIKESLTFNLHGIANIYLLRNQYGKAISFYEKEAQLSKTIGALQGEYEAYNGLSSAYREWGIASVDKGTKADYLLKSVEYYDQYVMLRDSVFNEEKQRDIGKLEARHEYEMASIKKQQQEKEEAAISLANQNRRNRLQYSASLLGICLLFGALFFVSKRTLPKWAVELALLVPFLILFEFLLILTSPYVDGLTGGEPGFALLINAALAGFIVPVHGFFEKLLRNRLFKTTEDIEATPAA